MAEWLKRQTVNLLGNRRWFESNSSQAKFLAMKLHQKDAYNLGRRYSLQIVLGALVANDFTILQLNIEENYFSKYYYKTQQRNKVGMTEIKQN